MIKKTIKRFWALISAVIIIAAGGGLAYAYQNFSSRIPLRQHFPDENSTAVWDWKNPSAYEKNQLADLRDFLYLHQVNTVYVDVGSYADIEDDKLGDYNAKVEDYIKTLGQRNIRVFAMAGNTDWSKPSERHKPLKVLQRTYEFNDTHTYKFAGLQWDIESYNQAGFPEASNTEKAIVLSEFLDTVDELSSKHKEYAEKSGDTSLEMGFAIPYWFDNQNGNIPSVTWKGKTGPTLFHLVDRLNDLPIANIVVMAYRNAALGNDGTVFHSRIEVEYAHSKAPNVRVIIGQEVNDVEPEKITFYGREPAELTNETKHIAEEFGGMSSYAGIAINDLAGLRILMENY